MSMKEIEYVENIVDREDSEYYWWNKHHRRYWNSRAESISCRVREKNNFNTASEIAQNIRAYLLGEDEQFLKESSNMSKRINEKDSKQLEEFAVSYAGARGTDEEAARKIIGVIIMNLSVDEIRTALHLEHVVSCRLLGYEKELFYLKCYTNGLRPVYVMRVLYHTKYDHRAQSQIEWDEYYQELEEKIDFTEFVRKIEFL